TSKLLKANANKRIATVDRHLGVVSCSALPPFTDPAISRTQQPTNNFSPTSGVLRHDPRRPALHRPGARRSPRLARHLQDAHLDGGPSLAHGRLHAGL